MGTANDLPSSIPSRDWLWDGFLKRGTITLLASRTRSGKTRLLERLIAATGQGGVLFGRPVTAARTILVKNAWYNTWEESLHPIQYPAHVTHIDQPFAPWPMDDEWPNFISRTAEEKPGLIAFDPFTEFLSQEARRNGHALQQMVNSLRLLTALNWVVLLTFRRSTRRRSDFHLDPAFARILSRNVDTVLRFERLPGATKDDPRRTLRVGRHHRGITLQPTADGQDYVVSSDAPDPFEIAWPHLKRMLRRMGNATSRKSLLAAWPRGVDAPSPATLARWLDRAVREGRLEVHGTGHRGDGFTYRLPIEPRA